MQAIDALTTRYSAKTLQEPAPDQGALRLIFQSAVHAPDHGRLRPWRFVVVRGAAREINKALGRPEPPPFEPAKAICGQ